MMERADHVLKQILFGGTIEDKLAGGKLPYAALDFDGVEGIPPIEAPGREGLLSTDFQKRSQSAFPRHAEIRESGIARGRLLHFFANHELLAIETMAYVLLRFPDAPENFKRGVFRVLQEEQQHFGEYISRMKEYGVSFGEVPLNLYFWNSLKGMRSPLDFVTQMSLTFEQANLDFALEYATFFENQCEDPKTAELLRRVHEDEVRHVQHGWKWFQEWRPKDSRTNFEVYQDLLPFPMTARRARGSTLFAAESRARAGLEQDYIREIRVSGGSRGKVPDLYFFNPQCEIESEVPTLSKGLIQKIEDLEPLMVWIPGEDDVLELRRRPPLSFLEDVHALRGELPEIITSDEELKRYAAFQEFKPWGFGASAWKRIDRVRSRLRKPPVFQEGIHEDHLFSKAFWKKALQTDGVVVVNEDDLASWMKNAKNNSEYIVKSGKGTSGRGHLRVDAAQFGDPGLVSKLKSRIKSDHAYVIEPYHDKVLDFSVQYEIRPDQSVREFEPGFFRTDGAHQYLGSYLGSSFVRSGSSEEMDAATRFLSGQRKVLRAMHEKVISILKEHRYTGPFGVDGLIARESGGGFKLVPVIEVNVRYTMGRIAHEIEAALRKRGGFRHGIFVFLKESDLIRHGVSSFLGFETKMKALYGANFVAATVAKDAHASFVFCLMNQDVYGDFGF